jgi:hypothetical protein
MPYISSEDRLRLAAEGPTTEGHLTYLITKQIQLYLTKHGIRYATQAQVLGALEGAKADFIRRVVSPYEASKERENGDVWKDFDLGREQ